MKIVAKIILLLIFIFSLVYLYKSWRAKVPQINDYFFDKNNSLSIQAIERSFYFNQDVEQSFEKQPNVKTRFFDTNYKISMRLLPLGYNENLKLKYTHTYSKNCFYPVSTDTLLMEKYGEVAFPNPCINNGEKIHAKLILKNEENYAKTVYARLFYQNTSYWWKLHTRQDLANQLILDNYYGTSTTTSIKLNAHETKIIDIPYTIGMDPKNYYQSIEDWKEPARNGNYEFMVLLADKPNDILMQDSLNLQKVNPFATIKEDELNKSNYGNYFNNIAYVGAQHFKFVFLDEKFDGTNDTKLGNVYIPKDHSYTWLNDLEFPKFKDIISENWTADDFFSGFIKKAPMIDADYGNRKENAAIENDGKEKAGIWLKVPKSTKEKKQKTWGEVIFGPSFKYGHITVFAKMAQMRNATKTPNGLTHWIWLYERDYRTSFHQANNPYKNITNIKGRAPYEIDMEFWSKVYEEPWDSVFYINYSILDYMRNPNVNLKPKEKKKFGQYEADRLNERQCNIPSAPFPRKFLNEYHQYEIIWKPQYVQFKVDGKETAMITPDMAAIPNKYMFLWMSTLLIQDGVFYNQQEVPFLAEDKFSHIKWIKIE
jgi:beta-glucanase (GH16 family)